MALASVALDSARTYLNDVNSQIWTDTVLLPYLKEAHRDMLLVLWLNGLPVIKEKSSTINVTALATTLTLPSDLIEPIWLKERSQGSSDQWIEMTETEFEPDRNKETTLNYWTWREEVIAFVGATTNREVLLRYWKSLAAVTTASSALGFILAEAFLGPQTAGYAAGSVGNLTLAGELLFVQSQQVGVAGSKLDMIVRANVKGQQNLPARRIPYRRFSRSRSLM
jgi:hypothetical protein